MLTINKQSDYGLILLSYIYKKDSITKLSELIEKTKLPKRFLARIAASLVKNNLLESYEGKTGGYQIGRNIKLFSLYDYLKIFEEKFSLCDCENKGVRCKYEGVCNHKTASLKMDKIITDQFKKTKLLSIIK